MVVVTEYGQVVGLITDIGPNWATVTTVLDTSLEISASVASAGYTGVAGSVINAARQTGSVVGVAVLGSLIASGDFLTGFHRAVTGASAVFAVAAIAVAVVLGATGRPERADAP